MPTVFRTPSSRPVTPGDGYRLYKKSILPVIPVVDSVVIEEVVVEEGQVPEKVVEKKDGEIEQEDPKRKTPPKKKKPNPLSKKQKKPKEIVLTKTPKQAQGAKLQPYLAKAMEMNPKSGTRASVYQLSQNEITPNKKQTARAAAARYNSTAGLGGPKVDHFGPIVRTVPIAVTDMRQLSTGNPYNIANEYGVTNDQFPLQEVRPTRGGQWSGRTGQIR